MYFASLYFSQSDVISIHKQFINSAQANDLTPKFLEHHFCAFASFRSAVSKCVWGKGVFLDTGNAINSAVRKIRRALHDDSGSPRFVATIPAKGYRFIASIGDANPASSAPALVRVPRKPLAARGREMAKLSASLDDASSGRGSLFLIAGEPGVGKTRLADEIAVVAKSRRMALLAGHCSEHDEAVAYLPFVEMLENFIDHASNLDHTLGSRCLDYSFVSWQIWQIPANSG